MACPLLTEAVLENYFNISSLNVTPKHPGVFSTKIASK
jgi:hypothetical protein